MTLLTQLADALASGSVKVVDLTQPLGPNTPVIGLPPMFGQSPGVTMEVISCFDDKGPAWYWNVLHLGEHTGTHFDAPVHWISGKDLPDNTCETIPAKRFVGPAVIDVEGGRDRRDYLPCRSTSSVGAEARAFRRTPGCAAHRLSSVLI